MTPYIHTRDQAKARARFLRTEEAGHGRNISHSAALEMVAHEQGWADWNTFSARLSNQPETPLQVGDRVCGSYLKQTFDGTVLSVTNRGEGTGFDVVIEFDLPVDVVTFDSFSNFRRRVNALISPGGTSFARTSDGVPHMVVQKADGLVV